MSNRSGIVAIVGGGLSGLVAAVRLGREGVPVALFEYADALGGRARGHAHAGFDVNVGPHRLFERWVAVSELRRLGLSLPVAARGPNGGFAIWRGTKHTFPTGCFSLLVTALFGATAKLELARFLSRVPAIDVSTLYDVPVRDWLRSELGDPRVVEFALALVRFTTYANDPDRQSAAGALEQLKLKLGGSILCLHRGWGTLVEALRAAAVSADVKIYTDQPVSGLNATNGQAASITLANGLLVRCRAVIVATNPQHAQSLLRSAMMPSVSLTPVCVAALDVGLERLPVKDAVFALGIDEPVYFSADPVTASVAPPDRAVVHLVRHLGPAANEAGGDTWPDCTMCFLLATGWAPRVSSPTRRSRAAFMRRGP